MNFDKLDLIILKNIITNKKNGLEFANENDPKLFTAEVWNFSNIIINYLKTYKELPTLRVIVEKLKRGNNTKLIETIKNIWSEIDKVQIDEKEYKHELEKIKKRFAEKQFLEMRDNLGKLDLSSLDINKSIVDINKKIQSIKSLNHIKAYDRKTLKEAIPTFREEYDAKLADENFGAGIKTGYSYLDHVSDGLRPGELLLIGGESGSGKSMLLMNMAIQIWMQNNTFDTKETEFSKGFNVLYFSLEMPFRPCFNRILGRLSGSPTKAIRGAKLDEIGVKNIKKALQFINKYPFQFEIIDIPRGATMESLELLYEDVKTSYNPDIVVIDYLGLMDYDGAEMEDWLKLGKIAEKCHEFSRVHNCVTLSAVQLNRASGKKDEDKIGLHRIGRSAMIMHNADIGIQINKRINEEKFPDMEYFVIKCRDGELGKGIIIKNLKCGTLIDQKIEEDSTTFELRDPDDISEKMSLIDGDDDDDGETE